MKAEGHERRLDTNIQNIRHLGAAIFVTAVEDYRSAIANPQRQVGRCGIRKTSMQQKKELERFFKTDAENLAEIFNLEISCDAIRRKLGIV